MTSAVVTQVVNHLELLRLNLQEQVLAVVRALDTIIRRGVSRQQLLQFAGTIHEDNLILMNQTISAEHTFNK